MKIENVSGNTMAANSESSIASAKRMDENENAPKSAEVKSGITEIEARRVSKKQQSTDQQMDQKDGDTAKDGYALEKQIKDAVSQANQKIRKGTSLEFSYHEETKRVSIQIIDKETKELVREIPPEKTLDMLQKMWELAGILVDEKG